MFAEYQPQQFVKLTANKQYFRGAPQLDEITYRYIPADSSRDLAFQSGELDMTRATCPRHGCIATSVRDTLCRRSTRNA